MYKNPYVWRDLKEENNFLGHYVYLSSLIIYANIKNQIFDEYPVVTSRLALNISILPGLRVWIAILSEYFQLFQF